MVKDGYGIFYGIPNDRYVVKIYLVDWRHTLKNVLYTCSIALWINTYESSKFSNGALMLENLFDAFEKTERLFQ